MPLFILTNEFFHLSIFIALSICASISIALVSRKLWEIKKLDKSLQQNAQTLAFCSDNEWKQWHKKVMALDSESFFHRLYDRSQQMMEKENDEQLWAQESYQYLNNSLNLEQRRSQRGLRTLLKIANVSLALGTMGCFLSWQSHLGHTALAPHAVIAALAIAIPSHIAHIRIQKKIQQKVCLLANQSQQLLAQLQSSAQQFEVEKEFPDN